MRPERWTSQMSHEFLKLLWIIEKTLAMEPDLENILTEVVNGECFSEDELPQPQEWEINEPAGLPPDNMIHMMEGEDS